MNGGDQAMLDAEALVHHLHHRRQAVGSAGSGRHQFVPSRFIEVMVDALDDVERFLSSDRTLHRAGHHHTLDTH